MKPPPPLEWHPYYRDRTWLLDWLEGRGPHAHLNDLLVPKLRVSPLLSMSSDELYPTAASPEPIRLTRHKAHGPAPYVGRPFRYMWPVGVDQHGRCIAGESRIVYERESPPADASDTDCKACGHNTDAHRYGQPIVCVDCPDEVCQPMVPG